MKKILVSAFGLAFFINSFSIALAAESEAARANLQEREVISVEDEAVCAADQNITREMFVRWALRNDGFLGERTGLEPFEDIADDSSFAPYAAEAARRRAVSRAERLFYPEKNLTGARALDILFKIEGIETERFPANQQVWTDLPNDPELGAAAFTAIKYDLWVPLSEDQLGVQSLLTCDQAIRLLNEIHDFKIPAPKLDGVLRIKTPKQQNLRISINSPEETADDDPQIAKLKHVIETLNNLYIDETKADKAQMVETAIQAILEGLGDKYSSYYPPEAVEQEQKIDRGENIVGVGMQVRENEATGEVFIVRVFTNAPAFRAGLRSGDVITVVNGEDVTESSAAEIAAKVSGEAGGAVNMTVRRDGRLISVAMKREAFVVPFVESELENNILTVHFYSFDTRAVREFEALLEEHVRGKNLQGIIIDLRKNPGGSLTSTLQMLGFFLPKEEDGDNAVGIWNQERDSLSKEEVIGDGEFTDIPLVVLVDRYSASGSEVFAGAIQDHNRGLVIGEQTYGKGTGQRNDFFSDGSKFRFTITNWLTPNKRSVEGVGITPDVIVPNSERTDAALERAQRMIERRQVQSFLKNKS